jgi:hypothetical protein
MLNQIRHTIQDYPFGAVFLAAIAGTLGAELRPVSRWLEEPEVYVAPPSCLEGKSAVVEGIRVETFSDTSTEDAHDRLMITTVSFEGGITCDFEYRNLTEVWSKGQTVMPLGGKRI